MTNETNNTFIDQIQKLQQYLPKEKKEELADILSYGEKYQKWGKKLKDEFWKKHEKDAFFQITQEKFINLLLQYEENEQRFMKWLNDEEKKIIGRLNGVAMKKFFEEYLYDWIVYNGDEDFNFDKTVEKCDRFTDIKSFAERNKDKLQAGMEINLSDIDISLIGLMVLVKQWKGKLKQRMYINLYKNYIGDEGIKMLTREWKDSLQSGIMLNLGKNYIGDEGIESLVREWKDNLQPGMHLELSDNKFGLTGLEILVNSWKDKLQPGMYLDFRWNRLGDEGVELLTKMQLRDGMILDLRNNEISDEMIQKLKEWEKSYHDKGIKCKVLVEL